MTNNNEKALKHPRIFTYLHIPVQSGSNQVLFDMKRKYNIEDFNNLCEIMTSELPDIQLCTDIIAGFPTETAEDWHKTMQVVRQWKFPSVFISPFFPRPGTPAAKMEYVYGKDKVLIH
ncbi:CDK5 regulatory subunit-associated protein 1-like protein [Reticulomyxa filosa]|uniref:CDK5 regulatory subunit-associated protein 1-like protein n=1 Tax=Reticulomyxa filosa TaxID=46433 RepID=X6LZA7_RETFI|nr:CDK5 regulatory subunit-associated protein 1-like protein [Reticulomyxa filosa]|eukprot:ETO06070.1 CDK5 regulatory subunit-associated protein 1-like protein [Reticulomyxa filosa]